MQKEKKEEPIINAAEVASEQKKYYPNLAYNRSKLTKAVTLSILLVVMMGLFIGSMIAGKQWWVLTIAVIMLLFVAFIAVSTIKSYPTKPDVPELTVYGHDVITRGKQFRTNEIEKIVVTVLLDPISKDNKENKEYIKEVASKFPEEQCFGTLDIYFKPSPKVKKGETIYLTIEDVLGATVDLVNAGVKHYGIYFSLKKLYEPAAFSLTKTEKKKAKLSDVSDKERRRQVF